MITANEGAYEGVRTQYEVPGELSLIEVLNARQELFTSQVMLVQARVQVTLSHLQLLAAQLLLTAEHLQLPAALYRPEDDYRDTRPLDRSDAGRHAIIASGRAAQTFIHAAARSRGIRRTPGAKKKPANLAACGLNPILLGGNWRRQVPLYCVASSLSAFLFK